MIEQKSFKVDTTTVAAQLLLRLSSMGITTTLQSVGSFIDAARNDVAQISAHYYLARISHGKSISMDAIYVQINQLVTNKMCRYIPSMTGEQIEKARVAVLQTIATVFTHQYPVDTGRWDYCKLVSLTPSEFVINVQRQVEADVAINADVGGFAHQGRHRGTVRYAA